MPSTAFTKDVCIKMLAGKDCCIEFEYENSSNNYEIEVCKILFTDVEAYKCTFLPSLTTKMLDYYDKLVEIENTDWLKESINSQKRWNLPLSSNPETTRHLIICFDDGPCFEFLCRSFETIFFLPQTK